MNKLKTIIAREYISRVKKKSFLILTFLSPFLFALIILIPVWIGQNNEGEEVNMAVVDKSNNFQEAFISSEEINFNYFQGGMDSVDVLFDSENYDAVIYLPEDFRNDSVTIYSAKSLSLGNKSKIKYMINAHVEKQNLLAQDIDPVILIQVKENIPVKTLKRSKSGELEKSSSELNTALGFAGALIIYMFIFIYGASLMRGAMEEKTGRVVEIIVSSARPFELMLGKIIGVAMVAFTQFGIWIASIAIFIAIGNQSFLASSPEIQSIMMSFQSVNFAMWIPLFIFYFIGGYLLYGSLFAAIGAAVDNETDTQQFMLPITIPLILAFIFAQSIIENPSGQLAVIMSQIPFTSPIVMMVRIGFGVPAWEILLSMFFLILTFIFTVWIASKIYRIGILSYGKKITYAELWKWIRYKG
ncbi:MAG: ABC transporter permease [Bacteroidota bacterium]|nr:ABC transporter permease [Bacteroidota bacterium]